MLLYEIAMINWNFLTLFFTISEILVFSLLENLILEYCIQHHFLS